MNTKEILTNVKKAAEQVNRFLDSELNGKVEPLWPAARHYISAGGKRLRPYVVTTTFEMINQKQSIKQVIPVAAAIEVLHNFTLVHDDIMDKDPIRRGIPTVHTKWDESTAILSGDLLFTMAFLFVLKTDLSDSIKTQVTYQLANVSKELCEGQMMDISFENRNQVSIDEYFEMIRLKTGALFKTSAAIGGICAEASIEQIHALEIYGETMGIAFQLIDDILGIIANEKEFGKPVGSDIREGKKTIIYLKALETLPKSESTKLFEIYQLKNKTDDQIKQATELLIKSKAIEGAKDTAIDHMNKSIEALKIFENVRARSELEDIARITIDRQY